MTDKFKGKTMNYAAAPMDPLEALQAMQKMKHKCHWPGCSAEVPPRMWGCKKHWFRLPKRLRDAIWRTYVPGQEVRKDPTAEYLEVANEVQQWCLEAVARAAGWKDE